MPFCDWAQQLISVCSGLGLKGTLLESVAPKYDISLDALAFMSSARLLNTAQIGKVGVVVSERLNTLQAMCALSFLRERR